MLWKAEIHDPKTATGGVARRLQTINSSGLVNEAWFVCSRSRTGLHVAARENGSYLMSFRALHEAPGGFRLQLYYQSNTGDEPSPQVTADNFVLNDPTSVVASLSPCSKYSIRSLLTETNFGRMFLRFEMLKIAGMDSCPYSLPDGAGFEYRFSRYGTLAEVSGNSAKL